MTPSPPTTDVAAERAPRQALRPRSSLEEELAAVFEELRAARELHSTFDPDSPPWSAEAELRRLELRWRRLTDDMAPSPSPGGGMSGRSTGSMRSAA